MTHNTYFWQNLQGENTYIMRVLYLIDFIIQNEKEIKKEPKNGVAKDKKRKKRVKMYISFVRKELVKTLKMCIK